LFWYCPNDILSRVTVPERILEAATRRFVREGVMASRLEDIRGDAGVSVGAVYHHFADKRELHAEAFLRALTDYQEGFAEALAESEDAEGGVKEAVRYNLRWVAANREAAALLLGERPTGPGAGKRLAEQNRAFFKTVLRWWRIHAGYGALRELEPAPLYSLWLGPAHEYTRHWLAGRESKLPGAAAKPSEVGDLLAEAAWASLKGSGRS
jgi:AcrR family transcriptional regulator